MNARAAPKREAVPETIPGLPRATTGLIGQAAAEQILLDAYASGRMHHAWILTGPAGIGKATLAYRFARFLLAGGGGPSLFGGPPESLAIDAAHPVAQKVAAGSHLDLTVLERGRNDKGKLQTVIPIDAIRSMRERLHHTAADGGWRIILADAVEDMNPAAANAFLKMLEEPPRQTIMLLVSHHPGQLLPTIRSRCRRLPMRALDDDEIVRIMQITEPDLPVADLPVLARLAQGSAGLALDLARQGGMDVLRDMLALLADLPRLDRVRLHRFADKVGGNNADAQWRTFQRLLPWWIGRLVRHQAAPDEPVTAITPDEPLVRLAAIGSPPAWLDARARIERLFERADAVHLEVRAVVLQSFLTLQTVAR